MSFSKVSTNKLPAKIDVPTSKSYANRALILAAITEGPVKVSNISWAQDVIDMLDVLEKIGLKIERGSDFVIISNSFPACEQFTESELTLNLGEGGTTSRFLVGLLSLGSHTYHLHAQNRMTTRPMYQLYNSIRKLGVEISVGKDSFPVTIKGPINYNQKIEIDCSETTQFYSSLLLISKKINLELTPINLNTSEGYVEITKKLISNVDNEFIIPVDFSSASYPIAFASLNQELTITNCFEKDELQGDSQLLDVLGQAGVSLSFDIEGLQVKPTNQLNAFEVDCKNCPDLVPTLCYLAAYANGTSQLSNIANLKHKESDRIKGIMEILKCFDVKCSYDDSLDELMIEGALKDSKIREITTEHDHRMVMAAALFLKHNAGGEVSPSEATSKSYPGFFDIF